MIDASRFLERVDMDEIESKVYEELKVVCSRSDSISGTMFACSQVYLNYENKISRENFLNQINNIKLVNDKSQNLEFFIELFLDKRKFNNFLDINKYQIINYGKAKGEKKEEKEYVDNSLFKIE